MKQRLAHSFAPSKMKTNTGDRNRHALADSKVTKVFDSVNSITLRVHCDTIGQLSITLSVYLVLFSTLLLAQDTLNTQISIVRTSWQSWQVSCRNKIVMDGCQEHEER
jgi:hypothetical protein